MTIIMDHPLQDWASRVDYRRASGRAVRHLLQLALGRAGLEHVRDGDAGVAGGEVRVVPTTADGNTEPVAGHAVQRDVVVLPDHPLAALQHTNGCRDVRCTLVRNAHTYTYTGGYGWH